MSEDLKNFCFAVYHEIAYFKPFSSEVCAFIACQFALESAAGTSRLAVVHSNYCGMKYPLVRPSLAGRADDTFASYHGLSECVFDYVLCLTYHRPTAHDLDSLNAFKFFLSKFYCPGRDYIKRIEVIYNQFINLLNS